MHGEGFMNVRRIKPASSRVDLENDDDQFNNDADEYIYIHTPTHTHTHEEMTYPTRRKDGGERVRRRGCMVHLQYHYCSARPGTTPQVLSLSKLTH